MGFDGYMGTLDSVTRVNQNTHIEHMLIQTYIQFTKSTYNGGILFLQCLERKQACVLRILLHTKCSSFSTPARDCDVKDKKMGVTA